MTKQIKQIQQGGLRRRLALGAAGARSGLGLLSSRASALLVPKEQQQAHHDAALEREALRFVAHLGELKGAYVKIGQMLALYGEHILPKPITRALHTLEDQTCSLEWDTVRALLASELGGRIGELQIDSTAFAAASLAQVHRAQSVLKKDRSEYAGGLDLALKVQYPGIAQAIDGDFDSVIQMLKLSRWLKAGRDVEEFTQQLKVLLKQEVDYGLEMARLQKFDKLLADDPVLRVPTVYPRWSTNKCLAMEYIEGYAVTHEKVQALSQSRRNALAKAMLKLFFKEVFEWQAMQTDPNFGNYRIQLNEGADDQLVLLDFGAVHDLPNSFTRPLQRAIIAAFNNNHADVISALIELRCLRTTDSSEVQASFAEFCCFIIEPFRQDFSALPEHAHDGNLYDWRNSRLLRRAGKLGSQKLLLKGFVMPPQEFMLLVRKLTGVFTFVSTLDAKINSYDILEPYL